MRREAILAEVTLEWEDAAASGSVGTREKMMALAIIMIIPPFLGKASPRSFGFCVSASFRSARFSSQGVYTRYTCRPLSFSLASFATHVPFFP